MSTVLVTGSTGFIGRHLVEALVRQGDNVRCLLRPLSDATPIAPFGVDLARASFADFAALRQALQGIDTVYHLGGLTSALRVSELYGANAEATANLARACAAQKSPPKLIFVSSIAAAGPTRRGRIRVESDPVAPVSHYGASKRAGEIAVEQYARNAPSLVVRPGIVFGPHNRELLPVFQSIAAFRIHVSPTFAPPRLSLIHVADLVELLLLAASRGKCIVPGSADSIGYYFAADREHPTYLQLGRMIARSLGFRRVVVLPIAHPLPWLLAAIAQGANQLRARHDTFNIDKMREAFSESWACSGERAERELGFRVEAPLLERLRQTAAWYRSQGHLNRFGRRSQSATSSSPSPIRRDVA